ncbi:MAG TPA: LPS assembly protein LptD [Nevskiaceae bacterium]|nr:LPS assembly protein LptD [Nevskiaceae bacterium]
MRTASLLRLPALIAGLLAAATAARADDDASRKVNEAMGCPQLDYALEAPEAGPDDEKLRITADKIDVSEGGLSNLLGGVKLHYGGRVFSAESMDYDDANRIVTVDTESLFRNDSLIIKAEQVQFNLNEESGTFTDTSFTLPVRAARGTAHKVALFSNGVAKLDDATYTTCAPGSDAWYLRAGEIKLNHEEGLGTARDASLRFFDVPILYVPWFQFPIDDRRRTGLLYPTVGQLSGSGIDFRWPVYLNLAPNYDATFTPRYLSDRGLQPGLDFRYLLSKGKGEAHYEFLDDRKYDDQRSLIRFGNAQLFNDRLGFKSTYARVSDRTYFEDLGGALQSSSLTHLEQAARLTYNAPAAYTVSALVQNFQPITTNLGTGDNPYQRLPQIRFDAITKNEWMNTRAGIGTEFVNFARDNSVEGMRYDLQPYIRFSHEASAWYFTSQADMHYTEYDLRNVDPESGLRQDATRSIPVVSAEGGLRFERMTDHGRLQTLEPRGFALYVPHEDQDDQPLFDTGEPDFDFVQLFARNRFSGEDRLADAQHVAGAMTLRQLDPYTGIADWTVSIGQLFRFEEPRVAIPGFPPPDKGATEFIGQVDYRIARHWTTTVSSQWAPKDEQFDRTHAGIRYSDDDRRRSFEVAYRYRRELLEQIDTSFVLPIFGPLRAAARTRYSLRDDETRETYAGVEYGTCCWTLRASYRRYIAAASGDFDQGIYLQLELMGLTKIGAGYDSLLPDQEMKMEGTY